MATALEGFLTASELPEDVKSTEPKIKKLSALKNGTTVAVPVNGLVKRSAPKRGTEGKETVTRWILRDVNEVEYQVSETLARQVAKGLQHAASEQRKGVIWKIAHDGKRVSLV